MRTKLWLEILKERIHFEDEGKDGRTEFAGTVLKVQLLAALVECWCAKLLLFI
jgi:hypothetical protein